MSALQFSEQRRPDAAPADGAAVAVAATVVEPGTLAPQGAVVLDGRSISPVPSPAGRRPSGAGVDPTPDAGSASVASWAPALVPVDLVAS